jgi:hypothetical protein
LIPATQQIHQYINKKSPGRESYRRLLKHCLDALQALTKTPIPVPTDWAQDITLGCTCADCTELQHFLRDAQERVYRLKPIRNCWRNFASWPNRRDDKLKQ